MTGAEIGVFGSTGFVGSAACEAIVMTGRSVRALKAPRSETVPAAQQSDEGLIAAARRLADTTDLVGQLGNALSVMVFAAGDPDASSEDLGHLLAANVISPLAAYLVAAEAGISRFVHVSSAVVQGATVCLSESAQTQPFSPYSESKARAENLLRLQARPGCDLVIYRPPSVHAKGRRVTRRVARLAASPFAVVAGQGRDPTPQALVANVGGALAFLATNAETPAPIVVHPWEGLTTGSFLELLGGRPPKKAPKWLVRSALAVARAILGGRPAGRANLRRAEMLLLGQGQTKSHLDTTGFTLPVGIEGWRLLAEQCRAPDPATEGQRRDG